MLRAIDTRRTATAAQRPPRAPAPPRRGARDAFKPARAPDAPPAMLRPEESLRLIPEFASALDAGGAAAFAVAAHARFAAEAGACLAAAGGWGLAPAWTRFSDGEGRLVQRSREGGMVLHCQTFSAAPSGPPGCPLDWGHQSFALGPAGAYSKTALWLSPGGPCPLTPHIELELFAPAAEGAPLLFYFSLDPRASTALYPAYVDRYYTSPPPQTPARPAAQPGAPPPPPRPAPPPPRLPSWAQLEAARAGDALFSRFASPSFHVRAFAATAMLFNVDSGPEGRAALLDTVGQGTAVWGAWLAADLAAAAAALSDAAGQQQGAAAAAAAAQPPAAAPASTPQHSPSPAEAAAAAAANAWLLAGAPSEAGGLGAALLAEAPALDAAHRRFPRREASAAAMAAAFGGAAMEAWWASVDGSARVGPGEGGA
ncbi:hypothetical protein Rsub_00942 [Raphidocelis subcapitata]|uniref:Red chlorophyll catabolite reductase n=1 Tax=Raphidocelis subcapitata TaxID=307507 RepID=A0A2V0NRN6_9CHLO|nr:hypothetical protein Rsub_00942 [Raphidocelis subcapitata]|eukprot:GBF88230.1 hypothetical protein Rsub_00942 [Raphidocelis subcapitata]